MRYHTIMAGDPATNPWKLKDDDFPRSGTVEEQLRFLLNYAILAPSGRNTQPWTFRINGDVIELFSDYGRELKVCDPDGRELIMSCGAALLNLRVAIQHFGYWAHTEVLPEEADGSMVARVRLLGKSIGTGEQSLFSAIQKRHSNRRPFDKRGLSDEVTSKLQGAASLEGANLTIVEVRHKREALADLIAEADRVQSADPEYRRELSEWLRPNLTMHDDGMPGYSVGYGPLSSLILPHLTRHLNTGGPQADKDRRLALNAPVLGVLWTHEDSPEAWLAAGQGLARVLLTACSLDVQASLFSGPAQVPSLRSEMRSIVAVNGFPQIILRLGYGTAVRQTPRRPLDAVVTTTPGHAATKTEFSEEQGGNE